jgi:molecular chaperone HscB
VKEHPVAQASPQPLSQPTRCRNCAEPIQSPIGCLSCHTIFPAPSDLTHFDRLGLPMRYDLSRESLDRSYLAWSKELHPDFHQNKSHEEQSLSLKLSASLNDAYATLSDPFRRAEYILQILGGPTASEHRQMPEGFLESVLELRMEIEEAKESPTERERYKTSLTRSRDEVLQSVGRMFHERKLEPGTVTSHDLDALREQLNTVKYYDGLLRELAE